MVLHAVLLQASSYLSVLSSVGLTPTYTSDYQTGISCRQQVAGSTVAQQLEVDREAYRSAQMLKQKRDRLSVCKAEAKKELAQLKDSPTAACEGSGVSEEHVASPDLASAPTQRAYRVGMVP
ncbi:hypothetical protein ABBQ38_012825 [Trebouxia sp. C0009 RCD-2024]